MNSKLADVTEHLNVHPLSLGTSLAKQVHREEEEEEERRASREQHVVSSRAGQS